MVMVTALSIIIDDIGHHLIPMKGTESSPFPPRDQLMKSLLSSWLIGNSYSWLIGPNPTHSSHQPKLIWQLSAKNNKIKPILLDRWFLLVDQNMVGDYGRLGQRFVRSLLLFFIILNLDFQWLSNLTSHRFNSFCYLFVFWLLDHWGF